MARELNTVGVVGLGTMGAGIVEVFARNGLDVVAVEADPAGLERGRVHLSDSTGRAVKRGKLTAQAQGELIDRVRFATSLDGVARCDLVIEAVPERLDLKCELFRRLDAIVRPEAILVTNTSSLSVTDIAVATQHPERVLGMHFFNPAPVLKLVEVIRTVVTDEALVDDVKALAERLGKRPVVVSDKAGFIANALLFGYLNHAVSLYESRYATREDLDAAMQLGCGLPMGPLALLDLIGLDTAYEILDTMYQQSRDRLHAPAPVLKQLVAAGLKGRKSGRGFYTYAAPGSGTVVPDRHTPSGAASTAGSALRPLSQVAVVGTGTMAAGIIEVLAVAGYDVTFVTSDPAKDAAEQVARVRAAVEKSLDESVQRAQIEPADRDAAVARITGSTRLLDLAGADLVVEAVAEDLSVKQALFEKLDEICTADAVLATTTSSLSVAALGAATERPAQVVGLHFFAPAPVIRLVEVVRTVSTADDVVDTMTDLCRRLGKHPVVCADRAGFIVNALLFPYLNDAVKMVEARYAGVDDIDTAMKAGCGYPQGPFEVLDIVGLDVALAVQRALYRESPEPGRWPAPLLEQLVTSGYLGRQVGRGFRTHA